MISIQYRKIFFVKQEVKIKKITMLDDAQSEQAEKSKMSFLPNEEASFVSEEERRKVS